LPLLYGPRWIAALLFAGLLPALFLSTRSAVKAGLLMSGILVFGLLDVQYPYRLPWQLPYGSEDTAAEVALRVMELNAGGGSRGLRKAKASAIVDVIATSQPHIVVIAECNSAIANTIKAKGN